jgi:hypothetical protein
MIAPSPTSVNESVREFAFADLAGDLAFDEVRRD